VDIVLIIGIERDGKVTLLDLAARPDSISSPCSSSRVSNLDGRPIILVIPVLHIANTTSSTNQHSDRGHVHPTTTSYGIRELTDAFYSHLSLLCRPVNRQNVGEASASVTNMSLSLSHEGHATPLGRGAD
jgi:hypothetical protein